MKEIEFKDFKGTVKKLPPEMYNKNYTYCLDYNHPDFDMDMFVYGMSARDEFENRVDPSLIRRKINGGYVIISKQSNL